jgi:hypothetical protein
VVGRHRGLDRPVLYPGFSACAPDGLGAPRRGRVLGQLRVRRAPAAWVLGPAPSPASGGPLLGAASAAPSRGGHAPAAAAPARRRGPAAAAATSGPSVRRRDPPRGAQDTPRNALLDSIRNANNIKTLKKVDPNAAPAAAPEKKVESKEDVMSTLFNKLKILRHAMGGTKQEEEKQGPFKGAEKFIARVGSDDGSDDSEDWDD